jgi:preprotein translocase subunit SecE
MATDAEKEKELEGKAEKKAEPAEEAPIVPADTAEPEANVAAPMQLGTKRFVYAAYFGGAIGVAFLFAKFGNLIWQRVESYRPQVGDPRDDIIMPIGALVGAITALYYWRKQKTRQYAEEVATELSQVTWPSRQEVTNSTTVVIIATAFATIFFALMDRFWAFVTDLVYRF